MLKYKEEKKDVEGFITDIAKNLSEPNKQRVADFLLGVLVAESTGQKEVDAKLNRSQGIAQCG
ncbi:hypothetical protein [uncultured Helicobacter sp.]|jgi:hypothetical protein|uniref:hypothetical protein n=1 Tax=uncultured Helicobacter sp. TaxID=175537 RepID=UPI002630E278|nr:hypothetical protein [uncultured Helicobacter sp.]